jgi:polyisoprenoid-binding protein YceI
MIRRDAVFALVAILAALLTACAPRVAAPPAVTAGMPVEFPDAYYQRLRMEGKPVFRVDAAHSLVVLEVRRGGSFAQFGHDHVISSHDLAGNIAPGEGRADLYVPLGELVVDDQDLRAAAGLGPPPDPSDIEGTRHNMLEKVLDAGRYPYALIRVDTVAATNGAGPFRVAMTLHGTTHLVDATTRVDIAAGEIALTGTAAIDQSEFGITPFSILGGAIAVQDRVNIRFQIYAYPAP